MSQQSVPAVMLLTVRVLSQRDSEAEAASLMSALLKHLSTVPGC